MQTHPRVGKLSLENLPELPRMMGETDITLIKSMLVNLPEPATILEIGPWLGGVSTILAQHGDLHVVDRFEWSELNSDRHPNVLPVGASSRPVFEGIMERHAVSATIHEGEIEFFDWQHGKIDFCLIDAPRTAEDLLTCLSIVALDVDGSGLILIKHGLNPAHLDMMSMLDAMISADMLEVVPTEQPRWCNIAVLKPGPKLSTCSAQLMEDVLDIPMAPLMSTASEPRVLLRMARLAALVTQGNWDAACQALAEQPHQRSYQECWDAIEPHIQPRRSKETEFAAFAELLAFHHSGANPAELWAPASQSMTWALRHYWAHLMQHDIAGKTVPLQLILQAQSQGDLEWLERISSLIHSQNVLEVGPLTDLAGAAFLTLGALSVTGIAANNAEDLEPDETLDMRMRVLPSIDEMIDADGIGLVVVHGRSSKQHHQLAILLSDIPKSTPVVSFHNQLVEVVGEGVEGLKCLTEQK